VIAFLGFLVALLCAAASARRVWFAANPTALHPDSVADALARAEGPGGLDALRALLVQEPSADWERDLLDAMRAPADLRAALVNEQLAELDYRVRRWERVPRVCARLAASSGFMLATLVLRQGLSAETLDLPSDMTELFINGLVGDALFVAAMGVVGTAFCVGAHGEARRIAQSRARGADALIERLEAIAA
jgi:hypothetical protein